MTTRRTFLKYSALSIGAFAVGPEFGAFAADVRPLIEGVAQACRRLAPLGWGEMLKDATGGQLDIAAADLKDELNKPLAIDRTYPGFGDFALSATRAVEPGIPDRSLLYQRSLRPPSLRTGRVSILEDSRLWRRWMRSRIMSTAPNHRPSMLFGRASMRCLRRSRVERRGESSVSWFTPCNIVTRRCPCMGAMPNSASLVPASQGWEQSNRSTMREHAISPRWTRRSLSNFASCRVVSRCILQPSSRGGADLGLRILCPTMTS